MKRYFLTLLTLLTVVVTVGTFTSCKDTEEDHYNELKSEDISLEKALEEQEQNLEDLRDQVNQIVSCTCDKDKLNNLEELVNKINNLLNDVNDYDNDMTILDRINAIEVAMINYEQKLESITGDIEDLQTDVYTLTEEMDSAFIIAYAAYYQSQNDSALIGALIDSLTSVNNEIISIVNETLDTEATSVTEVAKAIAEAVATLQEQVDDLLARVAALEIKISGIIIQGTYNPSFGSFSLPTGTQTNVLMAYYGTTSNDVYFPTSRTGNYVSGSALTSKDMEMIGFSDDTVLFSAGDLLYEEDDNGNVDAGTLYVTVNPSSVNFTGRTLTLENSQAEESYVKLDPLAQSDKVLSFGWTRAAENAFYEAHAYLAPEDISNVQKVSLNTTAARSMVNELLTNGASASFKNIAAGVISIVTSTSLDALAVKANNMDADSADIEGDAVYSTYNLAATAVKPLGFTSLDAVETKLTNGTNTAFNRVYSAIDGLFSSLYNMEVWDQLSNFTLDIDASVLDEIDFGLDFNVDEIQAKLDDLSIDDLAGIEVETIEDLTGATVDDNGGEYYTIDVTVDGITYTYYVARVYVTDAYATQAQSNLGEDFDDLFTLEDEGTYAGRYYISIPVESLQLYYLLVYQTGVETGVENELITALNEQLDGIVGELNGMTTDLSSILSDLVQQLGGIEDNMKSAIAEVLETYMGSITSDLNSMLSSVTGMKDTISNYESKVENYISTIQNYVTKVTSNISALAHPTLIVTSGSSYLSPSQSRYAPSTVSSSVTLTPTSWTVELVAPICKKHVAVTNVFNGSASAQDGDSACKSALDAANSLEGMNEVLDGSTFSIDLSGLQSGYTYQIAYSALDYAGHIATYKYYIKAE